MNIEALKEKLKQLETGKVQKSPLTKLIWKPKEGVQKIRIVPYVHDKESPFIELKFYYDIGGKHFLAPSTFGKPDPIMELIESLRSSGSDEEKKLAKKLSPSQRTYVPIIVRGEEDQGVKFWGFGVTVYKQLLGYITDPDWGDITSVNDGNDITINFVKVGKKLGPDGKPFPETSITPVPKKTPVVDPSRKDLLEKVMKQENILNVFPLPTYDELKDAMNSYLNPENSSDTTAETSNTESTASSEQSVSSGPAPKEDLAAAFEKIFNS